MVLHLPIKYLKIEFCFSFCVLISILKELACESRLFFF
nr:MAG TPA: hypothetical protein [Bacteriophage sp.]